MRYTSGQVQLIIYHFKGFLTLKWCKLLLNRSNNKILESLRNTHFDEKVHLHFVFELPTLNENSKALAIFRWCSVQ